MESSSYLDLSNHSITRLATQIPHTFLFSPQSQGYERHESYQFLKFNKDNTIFFEDSKLNEQREFDFDEHCVLNKSSNNKMVAETLIKKEDPFLQGNGQGLACFILDSNSICKLFQGYWPSDDYNNINESFNHEECFLKNLIKRIDNLAPKNLLELGNERRKFRICSVYRIPGQNVGIDSFTREKFDAKFDSFEKLKFISVETDDISQFEYLSGRIASHPSYNWAISIFFDLPFLEKNEKFNFGEQKPLGVFHLLINTLPEDFCMENLREEVEKGEMVEHPNTEIAKFIRSTFFLLQKDWQTELSNSKDSFEMYIADIYKNANSKFYAVFADLENGDFDDNLELLDYFQLCCEMLQCTPYFIIGQRGMFQISRNDQATPSLMIL